MSFLTHLLVPQFDTFVYFPTNFPFELNTALVFFIFSLPLISSAMEPTWQERNIWKIEKKPIDKSQQNAGSVAELVSLWLFLLPPLILAQRADSRRIFLNRNFFGETFAGPKSWNWLSQFE